MSVKDLVIEKRSRDIGDFLVGRFLPFRKKRMVGPFIFIDHMGPVEIQPDLHLDVDQHPHIGLSTLTFLLQGEIEHRDSLGSVQRITPGDVNLMTAGKGVTHTERTPSDLRGTSHILEGYQIWIALPEEFEEMQPEFHHIPASDLPSWRESGADFKIIVGEGFGRKSPVPVLSEMFMVEVKSNDAFEFDPTGSLAGETGILINRGKVTACENIIEEGNLLISKNDGACNLLVHGNTHLFLFGGRPFPEKRYIEWNFVSSSRQRLEKAKEDWRARQFPKVPGDSTYVPLP